MTKGKYANRADTRLRVLESKALRDAHSKISSLKDELSATRQQLNSLEAQIQSKAMRAAAALSMKEKANLRNEVASLQIRAKEDRIRQAVLVWELMFRATHSRPAPLVLDHHSADTDAFAYWLTVNWEIACLFFKDYDEIWEFFEQVEGHGWRMSGGDVGGPSGQPTIHQNGREANRVFKKGKIKATMMRRVHDMRAYYDRIITARQHGQLEPVLTFAETRRESTIKDDMLAGKLGILSQTGKNKSG